MHKEITDILELRKYSNWIYTVSKRLTLDLRTHIGWKRNAGQIIPTNSSQKRAGHGCTSTSDTEFKKTWLQETVTLYNDKRVNSPRCNDYKYIYAPNNRAPKYLKQTLIELKEEKDSSTRIVIEFSLLTFSNRWINQWGDQKEAEKLNNNKPHIHIQNSPPNSSRM